MQSGEKPRLRKLGQKSSSELFFALRKGNFSIHRESYEVLTHYKGLLGDQLPAPPIEGAQIDPLSEGATPDFFSDTWISASSSTSARTRKPAVQCRPKPECERLVARQCSVIEGSESAALHPLAKRYWFWLWRYPIDHRHSTRTGYRRHMSEPLCLPHPERIVEFLPGAGSFLDSEWRQIEKVEVLCVSMHGHHR